MKNERAFVRYTKKGQLVPGSLVVTQGGYPAGPALWKEVYSNLCCKPASCICGTIYLDTGDIIGYEYTDCFGKIISGTLNTENSVVAVCAAPGSVNFVSVGVGTGGFETDNVPCTPFTTCPVVVPPDPPPMTCYCYLIVNEQLTPQYYSYRDCETGEIYNDVELAAESQINICTTANYEPFAEPGSTLTITACLIGDPGSPLTCTSSVDCEGCGVEPPCCGAGTLEVNVTAPGTTINVITVDDGNAWYDVGGLGLPIDDIVSPRSVSLLDNTGGTLSITVDNLTAGDLYLYIYLDCVQVGSCCVVPADTTGHLCTFADFNISDFENQCMKIEVTNVSCT